MNQNQDSKNNNQDKQNQNKSSAIINQDLKNSKQPDSKDKDNGSFNDRILDVKQYAQKKPLKRKPQFYDDEEDLDKECAESIANVNKFLEQQKEQEEIKLAQMKAEYPKRFYVFHKILYDTEEQYSNHTQKHHKFTAIAKCIAKFQCHKSCQVFKTFGHYDNHVEDCKGYAQRVEENENLIHQQKHFTKLGQQLKKHFI
ncbi:hypothetical protein ABPG72_018513 [Tetrahymena utriculariae]